MRFLSLLSLALLLLASLSVISIFVALGFYAWPSADDYCMAAGVQQQGLLAHLWHHYQGWSGRYTGNALYAIFPQLLGMYDGYFLLPLLTVIGLFSAMSFLLARVFRVPVFTPLILLVSLCWVAVFLLGMKHTASSLYWLAGAMTYQTGNILLLVVLGLIIDIHDRQRQQRPYRVHAGLLFVIILLAAGSNEVAMLVLSGLLLLVYGWHRKAAVQCAGLWRWFVIVAAVGFAMVYFAPGNAIREATFPLRHQWQRSIDGSLEMGGWIVQSWLWNPLMLVTLFLTAMVAPVLAQQSKRSFRLEPRWLLLLGVLTLTIPFVLQFPAWWAMGGWPPPRTVDAIYFVFLLSLLGFTAALSIRYFPHLFANARPWAMMAGAILFIAAIAVHPQMQRAWGDLTERAKPYRAYMQDRLQRIEQARRQQTYLLKLPGFNGDFPRSIYFNDIVPDARDWRNVCYAQFHGLQWVARAAQKHRRRSAARAPFQSRKNAP